MRSYMKVLTAALIVFCVWNIVLFITGREQSELAMHGSIEDVVSAEACLIKTETIINSPTEGSLRAFVPEGKRVNRGGVVAAVVSGTVDEAAQTDLIRVKERIDEITKTRASGQMFADDAIRVEEQIEKKAKEIIEYTSENKISRIAGIKSDLVKLIDKKNAIKDGGSLALLEALNAEKARLEAIVGSNRVEIAAPVAGIFSTVIDGYETALNPAAINSLLPEDISSVEVKKKNTALKVNPGQPVCKIIDNFKWYVAVALPENEEFKVNDFVRLRFNEGNGALINATVESVSEPQDGKRLVVFFCSKEVEDLLNRRKTSVEIIKNRYEGLKLPIKALKVVDGVTGVYVYANGDKVFREVTVLGKSGEYMIVKEDNLKKNGLLLYDKVAVGD